MSQAYLLRQCQACLSEFTWKIQAKQRKQEKVNEKEEKELKARGTDLK